MANTSALKKGRHRRVRTRRRWSKPTPVFRRKEEADPGDGARRCSSLSAPGAGAEFGFMKGSKSRLFLAMWKAYNSTYS